MITWISLDSTQSDSALHLRSLEMKVRNLEASWLWLLQLANPDTKDPDEQPHFNQIAADRIVILLQADVVSRQLETVRRSLDVFRDLYESRKAALANAPLVEAAILYDLSESYSLIGLVRESMAALNAEVDNADWWHAILPEYTRRLRVALPERPSAALPPPPVAKGD